MQRTQLNIKSTFLLILVTLFLYTSEHYGSVSINTRVQNAPTDQANLLNKANYNFNIRRYDAAIKNYQELLKQKYSDSAYVYRKLAFCYAKSDQAKFASQFIQKHVLLSLDVSFVDHSYFDQIRSTTYYQKLKDKYLKKINLWSLFCLYVGFIGVFIFTVLTIKKGQDKIANFLISFFLLLHSFFIIRVSILLTNYEYYLPHALYLSASFSFLYGPVIYFYFKRVAIQYRFKKRDVLHLVPTIVFIICAFPIYTLSGDEKLRMILHNERPYAGTIMITKLISLVYYGVLIIRIYFKYVASNLSFPKSERVWQRNIIIFCTVYTISYGIYAAFIKEYVISGFFFNLQIILMSLLVLYISYNAFVQLSILGNLGGKGKNTEKGYSKYIKSNLTPGLSLELKEKLIKLLDLEKVYRQNDINLQKVADLLETTRNNASQVINEHFHLNFFELINSYRIREAVFILENQKDTVTIIDVAYEVGFNNKVTFNKSFKKYNKITPSEYLKSLSSVT